MREIRFASRIDAICAAIFVVVVSVGCSDSRPSEKWKFRGSGAPDVAVSDDEEPRANWWEVDPGESVEEFKVYALLGHSLQYTALAYAPERHARPGVATKFVGDRSKEVGEQERDLRVAGNGGYGFALLADPGEIRVLDPFDGFRWVDTIKLGADAEPTAVALHRESARLFVGLRGEGAISAVDLESPGNEVSTAAPAVCEDEASPSNFVFEMIGDRLLAAYSCARRMESGRLNHETGYLAGYNVDEGGVELVDRTALLASRVYPGFERGPDGELHLGVTNATPRAPYHGDVFHQRVSPTKTGGVFKVKGGRAGPEIAIGDTTFFEDTLDRYLRGYRFLPSGDILAITTDEPKFEAGRLQRIPPENPGRAETVETAFEESSPLCDSPDGNVVGLRGLNDNLCPSYEGAKCDTPPHGFGLFDARSMEALHPLEDAPQFRKAVGKGCVIFSPQ